MADQNKPKQAFGMLGGEDYPGFHLGLGYVGHHPDKVQDELGLRMRNDGQIGIGAFGYIFGQFDIDLILTLLGFG
jgi:hypothetical protein